MKPVEERRFYSVLKDHLQAVHVSELTTGFLFIDLIVDSPVIAEDDLGELEVTPFTECQIFQVIFSWKLFISLDQFHVFPLIV